MNELDINKKTNKTPWSAQNSWEGMLLTLSANILKESREVFKRHKLSHLSYERIDVLNLLNKGPHSQTALCTRLKKSPPTMMEMLHRLNADGMATSERDLHDRRQINWTITEKGKRDLLKAKRVLKTEDKKSLEDNLGKVTRPEDVDQFKKILQTMLDDRYSRN